MAATNRPKDSVKPPAWAQRGKLRMADVPGGPAHAAALMLLDGFDQSPLSLLSAFRYSPALADELAERGFNAVSLSWSPGFSIVSEMAQWNVVIALLPALKKRKIKTVARISLTGAFKADLFRAMPDAENWIYRDPDGSVLEWNESKQCCAMDITRPEWRSLVTKKVEAAVVAGFDGLFFDTVLANYPAAADFIKELSAFAASKRPPDAEPLLITCQASHFAAIARVVNVKCSPFGRIPGRDTGGIFWSNLAWHKNVYELSGRGLPFVSTLSGGDTTERARKQAVAEVFASGGSTADIDLPAAYATFFADNAELFSDADPQGVIGVLANDLGDDHDHVLKMESLLASLQLANLQHDIVPTAFLEQFDLKKYRLLSALMLAHWPSGVAERLDSYVRVNGGTLLVSPGAGTKDAKGNPCEPPKFLAEILDGAEKSEHKVGKGRVVVLPPPPNGFTGAKQADFIQEVVPEVLRLSGEQPVEVESAEDTLVLLWGKGTRRWVHVLNYKAASTEVTLTLPDCGGRTTDVFSPDEQKPVLEVQESGAGRLKFKLTGLDVYAVVRIA